MDIQILLFGSLVDVFGKKQLQLAQVNDTDTLLLALIATYPSIKDAKFVISVDKKITVENTAIDTTSEIALLPPFSGG
jgi:molybdopterin synthase sulfur carrier subunit